MGFLHKLWDETLAGPTPDTGLGKLRKYNSFSATSITVVRRDGHRNLNVSDGSSSEPSSPAGSTAPSSPFSPTTPGGNFKKFTRRKSTKAWQTSESESKNDWLVLS
ncbi:hypothetical protein BUALT_Bualt07G0168900 [Buddleja alternifolia]|uniref:Dormancy-associated protein homolog 4 n=1 Tax=Buddleja alternifolia TaxID=168488 RepID=A0AAV6XHX7_9LAMI|nr:hypothetical protein BUALT_Bualt07G0168900 [Buddleja alternifolia]